MNSIRIFMTKSKYFSLSFFLRCTQHDGQRPNHVISLINPTPKTYEISIHIYIYVI